MRHSLGSPHHGASSSISSLSCSPELHQDCSVGMVVRKVELLPVSTWLFDSLPCTGQGLLATSNLSNLSTTRLHGIALTGVVATGGCGVCSPMGRHGYGQRNTM